MNGVHDAGGMHFGPIRREEAEPIFHAPWEGRVRAMMMLLIHRRVFNIDEMRRTIESLLPAQYLTFSYFERWLSALRSLLLEKGALAPTEIDRAFRQMAEEPARLQHLARRDDPAFVDAVREAYRRPARPPQAATSARFRPGDAVVARNVHVREHTRLPRYVRGKRGVVHRVHGAYIFPDANAHGRGTHPQPVYSVRFAARELWGEGAAPDDCVHIDLWESYLEPA